MLERWCKTLVALGKTHPKLRWPLVALLALLYGGAALWDKAKALGAALAVLGREAASHLKETGADLAGWCQRLYSSCRRYLPLVMTRGREAFHASRQWCLARLRAAKTAVPVCLACLKGLGAAFVRHTVSGVGRMADNLRADLPAMRCHAPRRAMAMALTLCMALSLMPVSAFATETGECNHVHDETCGYVEAAEGSPCAHEHDETCGGLIDTGDDAYVPPEPPDHALTEITALEGAPEAALTAVEGQTDALALPDTLSGIYSIRPDTAVKPDGSDEEYGAVDIPVTWDGLPDPAVKGTYALTAALTLPEGYALAADVTAPTATMTLTADPDVDAVRTLLATLHAPADVAALLAKEDAADEDYALLDQWAEQAQAAQDAYDALTDGQKALLPEAQSTFDALVAAFRGEAATLNTAAHTHEAGHPGYIDLDAWQVKAPGGYSYTNTFETPIATAEELRTFIAEQTVTKNYTRASWGSAYLTADIDVSQLGTYGYGNLEIAKCVSICLNGHDIIGGNTPGETDKLNGEAIIMLYPDPAGSNYVNLDLHDCCGGRATRYGYWNGEQYAISDTVPSGEYDVIPGGMIRSTTGMNAGIEVKEGTTLNILGGTIAGNSYGIDQTNRNQALTCAHRRTRMYGGQIVGNKRAGIHMGTADMNTDIFGGRIANNRGGGVWNSALSSSKEYPGAIPVLSLGGTPEISGNTNGGSPCNIYLAAPSSTSVNSKKWAGKIQIIGHDSTQLASMPDHPIGVTMETPGTFTYTGDSTFFMNTEQYANYFVSDDPAYGIYKGTKESTEVKNINSPEVRERITLPVVYDSNGGKGQVTDPNSPYPEGTEGFTVMDQGDLTRENYLFCGWSTSPNDGSGVDYQPGETCYFSKANTLYAKWCKALTIEYYLDPSDEGVTGDLPPNETVGEGASHTFAEVGSLKRTGYMFEQWKAYNMYGKTAVAVGGSVSSVKAKDPSNPISLSPDWKLIPAAAPVITQQPQNITQGYGTNITLTCEAKPANDGVEYELSYQWRRYDSTSTNKYTEISSATEPTYTFPTPAIGEHYYACAVTATRKDNGAKTEAPVVSNLVTVTVTKGNAVKTWPTVSNLYVNQTLTTTHMTGGEGAGTFSVPADTSFATAGDHEVTLTFTPTDTTSYEVVTQTVSVHVSKYPVTSVFVYPRTVTYGTPYAYITMPETVTVYFANGSRELSVTWDGTQYDPNRNVADGPQYIPGTIAESAEVDVSQTKPECKVTFKPIEIALTIPTNLSATYTGGPLAYPHTPGTVEGLVSLSYEYKKQSISDTYTSTPPTAAGTYDVKATPTCQPNYGGNAQYLTFTIEPHPYGDGMGFTIAEIEPQIHTGSEIKPEPSVKFGETTLTKGTDFDYSYNSNIAPGTEAKVTITFKGNFSGAAEKIFTIENAELPEGTTDDDIFIISGTELMEWHRSDITLTTKDGWTVGLSADSLSGFVTLSDESTKNETGSIVPSSATLYVKNNAGDIYRTKVEYLLDKTMPEIVVDGMGNDGVNKIWDEEKTITIHITDDLSGVRYVQIMGQVAADTTVEYGDPSFGYEPLPADGTITYTVKANDVYTITAYDNADNQPFWKGELPTFVVEKIDGEKPTAAFGEITGTQGADGWFTGDITVNVTVEDPETIPDDPNTVAINESNKSGIDKWEYSLDGGTTWNTGSGNSFKIDKDGDYTDKLKLRATDNAGNVSETATASAKRDKAIPGRPIVTAKAGGEDYTSGAWTAKDVVFTLAPPQYGFTKSGLGTYQVKIGDAEWADVTGNTITHSTNTPDTGMAYEFRIVSGAGTSGDTTVDVIVKRRAMADDVKDAPANKYGESDFSIDSEGVKDGWYDHDVTVTVTKKENITDGSASYPADTWYKLDSGEKVKLDGTEIAVTGDGEHTLEIWTEDASGNETTHLELTIKIDTTAPTITDIQGNPTDWTRGPAEITFTADDMPSGVKSVVVTCDDGNVVEYTDGGFTADHNGSYTITVTDHAGNTVTETVTVDKIDLYTPVAPTVTDYTSDTWVKENITFALSTTDTSATVPSGTRFQVKIGDADWADVGGATYSVTKNTDGVSYSFRVISGAGAHSETVDFIVKLDKTAPVVKLDVKAGGAAYDGSTFTAHDVVITPSNTANNGSGVTYFYQKAGDADWTELTGAALTVDVNCDTTFTFKAVSGAGMDSSNQPTTQVKRSAMSDEELAETEYDESDFTVSPEKSGEWYTETPTVTVTPKTTVGVGGLAATTYYELYKAPAESGDKKELTGPWTIKPDSDGIWTLKVWTEDAAGNKTKLYIITLMVDTTVPTVTNVTGNATAWQNTDVTLTVNGAADTTSGLADLAYSFDGGTTWQGLNTKTFSANATVTVWVRDKAGNTYKHAPITIDKIDKTAPVVYWDTATAALSADKWYGKTALTATATDDSGEAPAITLTASGKTYANGATIAENGSYTFFATAKDGAGNVGRSTALTVRIETLIDDFVEMVDGLSSGSNYQDILDAVNWYNGQTITIKDRFSKSDAATAAYETLMGLLRDKAQEAADGVTDAIKDADTIDEIEQAAKDYDALPDEVKDQVPGDVKDELKQKKQNADAAQKVIDQLENANRDKVTEGDKVKDPGGSYDEKDAAQDAYDKLTGDQKALVNQVPSAVEDKGHIDTDLSAIDNVLDLLKDIQKPYAPATKDQIKAAGDAYDALTQKQKDAFPKSDKAKLDALEEMRQHAQAVEDKIKALGETPSQPDLNTAKGAYDSLTADEKAMVDGDLKTELDQKYQDMLDALDADEKAAAEFAAKVEEVKNAPTVDKIKDLIKDHDALSDAAKDKLTDQTKEDYQKLVDDLNAAQPVIDKLDDIDVDNLTPGDMGKVTDALDAYDKLTEDQKKLVDEATGGKADILDDAVKGAGDATDKIQDIPSHGNGTDIGTDCPGYSGPGDPTGEDHDYEQHRNAIEEAKIAYEKLTDAGRKLIRDEAKEKLNREYAALMAYLEYINTARTATTNVEVAGLAEKVELPAESASAPKTVISVVMADSKPETMPPVPAGKTEALSVDIKLVAKIYDNATDTPIAQEQVQPKNGEAVLVKLKVPSGYQNDTLELWHVKDSGGRSRIEDFWLVTEADGTYAVFEVSSFSHFVFFAEKETTPPTPDDGGNSSGSVTPPTTKPSIPDSDNGSTSITPKQPKPGDTVTIKPEPDDGYVVDDVVVTDQNGKDIPVKDNGDGTYSYTQPKGKVTVTVTFKPKETRLTWNPFTDVTERDWFYESVKYVYEKGLMNGTASDKFSPYLDTNRGMIVTILWRLEGEPGSMTANSFPDVAADSYCAKAVAWGAENGIVKGYGNGNFGPNDPITREQMAAILYRYTEFKGLDAPATGNLSQFTDQPSTWAAEAMRWAVGNGIITGKGGGVLDPTGKATRAEVATMFMRFVD